MKLHASFIKGFFEELLLYSGQFGLFYIIMQLIIEKMQFFRNTGHVGLSVSLLIQAMLLTIHGGKWQARFLFSFIVPIVYSTLEYSEGIPYLLNAAHIGFWLYALVSSILMIIRLKNNETLQRITEISLVLINVFIFLFLYFYFDTWKVVKDNNLLTITAIFSYLNEFLSDPTHWYIIIGGSLLAVTIALGRYDIARLKDRISALFGQYVDKNVRDAIIKKGEFVARKENLCILFSDIISFTKLCEKYEADQIAEMLNIYFEYWNRLVKEYNGTIDKYIGDAIMVIFGLDGAGNACDLAAQCASAANNNRNILFESLGQKHLPVPDGFGIGCHYGELIIGDIGSSDRKNFTVIGDTVNTASRLESVTRAVDSKVIISSEMYGRLSDNVKQCFESIGNIELKGKSASVAIWGNKV